MLIDKVLGMSDVWVAWAVAVTWQLATLAVVAWLCERVLRLRQPGARYGLWWFVLAAPLVLAPTRMALERREAVVRVAPPAVVEQAVTRVRVPVVMPVANGTPEVAATRALVPDSPWWSRMRPVDVLAIAWVTGCLMLMARLVVGHVRARRLVGESRAVADGEALGALAELCAEAGVRREVGLRVSSSVGAPVLYGVRRPTILLPEDWVETLAADDLRALLAHEVAHVRRGDCLANLVQRIVEIPLFFHPGAWLATRQVTLAREELADGWVLARGVEASSYARSLAAVADRAQVRLGAASVGVAEGRSTLLRRVEAIMRGGSLKRMSWPLVVALVGAALVSAGAFAAVKVTGEPRRESVRHAEASAVSPEEPPVAAPVTRTAIRGLLTAPDGKPASGVTVHMEGRFDSRRPETYPSQAVTDDDGRFELVLNGAAGKQTVWVFDEHFFAILARDIESRTGGSIALPAVTLQKSALIRGRVLNAAGGEPISGARVACSHIFKSGGIPRSVRAEAKTGPDGRFIVAAPPGKASLSASPFEGYMRSHIIEEGMLSQGHPGLRVRVNPDKPMNRSFEVRAGDSITGVVLFLEQAASVKGVVLGPNGTRWQHGGFVHATTEVDRVMSDLHIYEVGKIGADGAFRIGNLPSGVPMALVVIDDKLALGGTALVTTSAPLTQGMELQLHPLAMLRGRVLMSDRSPAVGAELTVEGIWRQFFLGRPPSYGPETHMSSRENGTFEALTGVVGLPTRVRATLPPWSADGPRTEYYGSSELFSVAPGQAVVDLGDIVVRKLGRPGVEQP